MDQWRQFRRMQRSTFVVAALIYAGAAVQGWRVLPGPESLKWSLIVVIPAVFAVGALVVPLQVAPMRRLLERYVWMSFDAGFGRTLGSVLGGFGLLVFAAVFIYLQIKGVAHGGRYPAGVFSGYAAGIGILGAQALMTGRIERSEGFSARL